MHKKTPTSQTLSPTFYSFADTATLGRHLARALGIPLAPVTVHLFPDRETLVQISPPVGRQAFLVRSLHNPNTKLIEALLAADALHRAGAQRVVLVAPYLPYMLQDMVFTPGESLSQKIIADCLGHSFDHIVTIEPHLHRIHHLTDVFPCSAVALSAASVLAQWIHHTGRRSLVVGPDEESEPWIRTIADFYRTESTRLQSEAEQHAALAKTLVGEAGGQNPSASHHYEQAEHCRKFAASLSEAAQEAHDLAKIHDRLPQSSAGDRK